MDKTDGKSQSGGKMILLIFLFLMALVIVAYLAGEFHEWRIKKWFDD